MQEISEKQRRTREKYAKKGSVSNKILIYMLVFLFISSIFVFGDRITKATNSTNDIMVMLSPIQEELRNKTPFLKNIEGINVIITPLAKYMVAGRAVETYDYSTSVASFRNMISGQDNYNEVAIKDVAIAYGPMALEENHNKMIYVMSGSRRISYAVNDNSLITELGCLDVIKTYITNNHLIAANSDVEELINKIDKDDYVQITGYLVNATWEKGVYKFALESSLSRDDVGAGACEIIYVEDVKWIK